MTLSLKTHEFTMKRGQPVISRTNPYVRLCRGEGPPVFIQGGSFYYEGGQEVKEGEFPDWLPEMLKTLSLEVREEVGLPPLVEPPKMPSVRAATSK